jgi:predicted nuclease with TOPRIM domain
MQNIQEIFNRIQKAKQKQKELRKMYKEALEQTPGYKDIVEDYKELRDKKKQIENEIKQDFAKEFEELDDLKTDIQTDQELLSDIAFNKLVKGETVEVTDNDDNNYEPIFTVKFKKM